MSTSNPSSASKRRGNPNWCKPEPLIPATTTVTSFESVVKSLNLAAEQYESSATLKEWVRKNKDQKYVPLDLLRAWGFTVKSDAW